MLHATGIVRNFGATRALRGVSLALAPHLLTVVLGDAGSGKTTLFNILAGFDRDYRGSVTLSQRPIDATTPQNRLFGVVQQQEAFLPRRTLRDNIALPLDLRGKRGPARGRLVEAAIELTDLTDSAPLYPHQATGDALVRAALARAVVAEPSILLLDDPLYRLHGQARANLVTLIARVQRMLRATTLLFTRDGDTALTLGDQVAVMKQGHVIETGTPDALYNRPATAEVASLIGQSCQFLGQISEVDNDIADIVLDCGPQIAAIAYAGARAGDRCRLFLRPERLAVAPMKAADMGEGAIDATVLEARACGENTLLRLLIGSGAEILATRPAAAGLRGLKPGATAAIAFQPQHGLLFPA